MRFEKIKIIISMTCVFILLTGFTYAKENSKFNQVGQTVIDKDIELFGAEIDQEIVIYDENRLLNLVNLGEEDYMNYLVSQGIPEKFATMSYLPGEIYWDCFSRVSWISRDDVWSLSIHHKMQWFNNFGGFINGHSPDAAFDALKFYHLYDGQWHGSNVSSMKNQFKCHFDLAKFKNPWNIEPSTPDKGGKFWSWDAKCN